MLPYSIVAIFLTLFVSEYSYRFIERSWIAKGRNYISASESGLQNNLESNRFVLNKEVKVI
jgi:hypothetical protein